MKKVLTIIALTILVWGCAKKLTPSNSATGQSNNGSTTAAITPSEGNAVSKTKVLEETSPEVLGQTTYNAKCGRCHGLKVTADYTADRWVSIMQVMATKANLTDVEKENVLTFVKANAKK